MNEQEYRTAKRKGDVRTLRKLREGTVTAVVETPDHPETLELMDAGISSEETPTEPQE